MNRVYLAGRYDRRLELCGYAEELRAVGHTVVSRWLDGCHEIPPTGITDKQSLEMARIFAIDDISDLAKADTFVFFSELPNTTSVRGGRFVELGMAIATRKRCIVVGRHENIFSALPQVELYPDWDVARRVLCG